MAGVRLGVRPVARLVLVAVVTVLALHTSATPSQAGIASSFYVTDEDGGGAVTTFTQADPIYLQARTDLSGGYVCVTAKAGSSCLRSPIAIPGFNSGAVPLFAPGTLAVGNYDLLETDSSGSPIVETVGGTASVQRSALPFAVVGGACPVNDDDICQLRLQAFKDAARRMQLHSNAMTAFGFIGLLTGAASAVVAVPLLGGGPLLALTVRAAVAGGLGFATAAFVGAAETASEASIHFADLAVDPPDPNFADVAAPVITDMARPTDPQQAAVFDAYARQAALTKALLSALERFQGARAAEDDAAAIRQAQAMGDYADGVADSIDGAATALRAIAHDGAHDVPFLAAGERDAWLARQSRLRASGLTAAEKESLAALGADESAYPAVTQDLLAVDFEHAPSGVTKAQFLDTLADGTSVNSLAFRELATEARRAATVIQARVVTLQAKVRTDTTGGYAPLAVTFDGSQSIATSPGASFAWSFSDGTSATGKVVSRRLTDPGPLTATLRLTDSGGQESTASATVSVTAPVDVVVPVCGDQDSGTDEPRCSGWRASPGLEMYRVAGTGARDVQFDWIYRDAGFSNELFYVPVDDGGGAVDGLRPGQAGYEAVFYARARTVFPSGSDASVPDVTVRLDGGQYVVLGIVASGSLADLRQTNPGNANTGWPMAFTTISTRNPDGQSHVLGFTDAAGVAQFGFEDILDAGPASDYDDVVFTAKNLVPIDRVALELKALQAQVSLQGIAGYGLSVHNPGLSTVRLSDLTVAMPSGFRYLPGSTTGFRSDDPTVSGQNLTWPGPIDLDVRERLSLGFELQAGGAAGTFRTAAVASVAQVPLANTGPTAPLQVVGDPVAGTFTPVTPHRLLDTRAAPAGPVGVLWSHRVRAGEVVDFKVAGVGGVPLSGVDAVVLNVTAVRPSTSSYVTAYPTGKARPGVSNLSLTSGTADLPNLVVVRVGDEGKVSLYNNAGDTDLVADVMGWYAAPQGAPGHRFTPTAPTRLLDTRLGLGAPKGVVGGGRSVSLKVAGLAAVPTNAKGVVMNVTATGTTARSYLTVYPSGVPRPLSSNLNWVPGMTVPNLVYSPIGSDSRVVLYNHAGSAHLIADVVGWFGATGSFVFHPVNPQRVFDTRATASLLGPGTELKRVVTGGQLAAPSGARAVVLNATVTGTTAASYLTVYADTGAARPTASNLNWTKGATRPNAVTTLVGPTGGVRFYNASGSTHLIADLNGWYGP